MQTLTKSLFLFLGLFLMNAPISAQVTLPANSPHASVSQKVGLSKITINYSRPSVKEREIWGSLVPYGYNDFGFGTSKAAPWRAGADKNTTITLSDEATIGGKKVAAGTYGLHMAIEKTGEVTVILSQNNSSWGSYFYNDDEDVTRVEVKWQDHPHTEMLTFTFDEVTDSKAHANLLWEKKKIAFPIEFDTPEIVMASLANELRSNKAFNQQAWENAASYALNNNDLNQALTWVNNSIEGWFFSKPTFGNMSMKAQILAKQGKTAEADKIMEEAMPMGTALQIHGYGRQLIAAQNVDKAMEVFKYNLKNNPNTWPVNFGMGRGYSAKGDYKTAISYLEKAKKNAPAEANRKRLDSLIAQLKEGKDIN